MSSTHPAPSGPLGFDASKLIKVVQQGYDFAVKGVSTPSASDAGKTVDQVIAADDAAKNVRAETEAIFFKLFCRAVGIFATTASGGVINSNQTDAVLVFIFASTLDLPVAQTQDDVVLKKLDAALNQMKGIEHVQDEVKDLVVQVSLMKYVTDANDVICSIWRKIHRACEHNDKEALLDEIKRIKTDDVERLLGSMFNALISTNFALKDPLAPGIKVSLKNRLVDQDHHFDYNIAKYWREINHWSTAFNDVERMGVALLLLHEQGRDLFEPNSARDTAANLADIGKESVERIKAYNAALLGDVLDWPSSRLLHDAAIINTNETFPKLWVLRTGPSKCIGTEQVSAVIPGVLPLWKWMEVDYFGPTMDRAWGLVPLPDGTWHLRGSHNSEVGNVYNWTLNHDSKWRLSLALEARTPAIFKIIPEPSPVGQAQLTLVLIDPESKTKKGVFKYQLEPTSLPVYPLFDQNSVEPSDHIRRMMGDAGYNVRVLCSLYNNTPHVMVLSDVLSTDHHAYSNTVWIPGDSISVCAASKLQDVTAILKFTTYQLSDQPATADLMRARIKELFFVGASGKPGLLPSGAKPLSEFFVRLEVPTAAWNAISAIEMHLDDPKRVVTDIKTSYALLEALDSFKLYSKTDGQMAWHNIRAETRIEGGDATTAFVKVYTK